jgi:hypothetical protein
MQEGENGMILNAKTGKLYTLDDPCVERGSTLAYNETAREATVKASRSF